MKLLLGPLLELASMAIAFLAFAFLGGMILPAFTFVIDVPFGVAMDVGMWLGALFGVLYIFLRSRRPIQSKTRGTS